MKAVWAVVALVVLAAPVASANVARVLDSEDDEIIIELATDDYSLEDVAVGGESFVRVRAPRYSLLREEGRPLLPQKAVLVGVPFGARLSFEVVAVESENLGRVRVEPAPHEEIVLYEEVSTPIQRFAIDEEFYSRGGTFPGAVAELGEQGALRYQRVARVVLNPFQYSPASGTLTLHTRIAVRVSVEESRRQSGLTDAVRVEPEWERVYERSVLNHEQAARWRARPEPKRGVSGPRYGEPNEAYKLMTTDSGMHRIDFSELASEGLGSSTPVDDVAVFQRSFDAEEPDPFIETPLAIDVVDVDGNDYFDGDDYVLFFARSFEEQHMEVGYEDRYGTENAYWFAEDGDLAVRMSTRDGWLDEPGLTPPVSFRDTVRFEEDVYFYPQPDYDDLDLYHWSRYQDSSDNYQYPFALYDVHEFSDTRMRSRYQGMTSGWHYLDFRISYGDTADNYVGQFAFSGISQDMDEDIYVSGPIANWFFTDGDHEMRAVGSRGSGANMDWFRFEYDREFTARERRLGFTNAGQTGESEFEVDGFSTDGMRLFDTTDPFSTSELELGPENVSGGGGDYTLAFQDDVSGFTRYEAVEPGGYRSVTSVERRQPADLWSTEADLIVVAHENFESGVEPLLAHRESEGWMVARAAVGDVYDEFGGGLKSLEALKGYFTYAFENWDRAPQFVMLVGDATDDPRNVDEDSQPDFIPTVLGHGSASYPQMTASDQWFVSSDEGPFYFPNMFIGRLSVGNGSELDNLVEKILTYEDYSPGEEWRNTISFFGDDQWNYGTFGGNYRWDWGESEFTTVNLNLSEMVAASPAGIDTSLYMLRRYTTPFHESNGVQPGDQMPFDYFAFEVYPFVREQLTPALTELWSEGALLVNFQGHGNREQMTHEQIFQARRAPQNDMYLLVNEGKPFIFTGFSCHLAQFHYHGEGITNGQESIVEQMLFLPSGRGAVAGFACAGAAYLSHNSDYNTEIFEAFFDSETPTGDPADFFWPRWTLGSILGQGTVDYITAAGNSTPARTYVLLGDPLLHFETSPPTMQVTVDGEPLLSGEFLEASDGLVTFVADIIDEVEIDPASIVVTDRGGVVDDEFYTVEAVTDTLAEIGRWYRLTYDTTIVDETYDITFSATDMNGQTTTFVVHVVGREAITLDQVINHPNPFSDRTKIIYMLNQSDAEVSIDIYTVGGRLIKTIDDAPGDLNYNEVEWDGVDDDGDLVANGLYLYVVEAKGEDGSTATSDVGRMAVVRGPRADRR